jgi:tRNA threonylcarbamoyladenosine biosynthesis protein TsaE
MERLGTVFSYLLQKGDTILLKGDLGAGKSTFSRGVVRGILQDSSMIVTSPSYLLDNNYETTREFSIHHMDLFRLPTNCDLKFLNIPEVFENSLCLVEWPDRLGHTFTPKRFIDLMLKINSGTEIRVAQINFVGDEWKIQEEKLVELLAYYFKSKWRERKDDDHLT